MRDFCALRLTISPAVVFGAHRRRDSVEQLTLQTSKVFRQSFTRSSEKRVHVMDITKEVRDRVLGADIDEGMVFVNSRYTTCGLLINEFQGALIEDLQAMLEQLVPENGSYRHNDPRYSDRERGNASALLRASLPSHGVAVGVRDGIVSLGRFQAILMAELDGPQTRDVDLTMIGGLVAPQPSLDKRRLPGQVSPRPAEAAPLAFCDGRCSVG
jgi:secondary thiamine-phosphate synthase enzyme